MGMFDTVVIEGLKLPNLPKEINSYLKATNSLLPNDYQTKDLENFLSTYTIDKKGQIYLTEYKPTGKKIPYQSPFQNWTDNRSFLERVYFNIRNRHLNTKHPLPKFTEERKAVKVKTNITQTFKIYNYVEIVNRYIDVGFEVTAVKGKVVKISLSNAKIEPEKDARARHKNNEEFDKKMASDFEKRRIFKSKWYYPVLKEVYNPFVFFSSKAIQGICSWIIKQTYRWHGV